VPACQDPGFQQCVPIRLWDAGVLKPSGPVRLGLKAEIVLWRSGGPSVCDQPLVVDCCVLRGDEVKRAGSRRRAARPPMLFEAAVEAAMKGGRRPCDGADSQESLRLAGIPYPAHGDPGRTDGYGPLLHDAGVGRDHVSLVTTTWRSGRVREFQAGSWRSSLTDPP